MNTTNLDITRSQNTACFALFSDRSAHKVLLDVYAKMGSERISLRSTVKSESIRSSADCGFSSALTQFERRVEEKNKNHELVWDFDGNPYESSNYDGLSAGLAFFTAFLVKLTAIYCSRNPERCQQGLAFRIAATGVLSNATSEARVERVEHFAAKLQAVLAILQPGDKVLYPHDNQDEIHPDLKASFESLGIDLVPVSTPGEAAQIILGWFLVQEKHPCLERFRRICTKMRHVVRSRLFLAWTVITGLWMVYFCLCRPSICSTSKVLAALEYGEFEKIIFCRNRSSIDPEMVPLLQQMRTPLRMTNSFIYLDEDQPLLEDAGAMSAIQNVVLDSSMGYRFEVQAQNQCYFYLFQFSDDSTMEMLFPASGFELENHLILDNQLFMIPGGVSYYYFTDVSPRRLVTLCFLGTVWRARDIEALCNAYSQVRNSKEMKKIRDRTLVRLQKRKSALQRGFQGLYYDQSYFWRQ